MVVPHAFFPQPRPHRSRAVPGASGGLGPSLMTTRCVDKNRRPTCGREYFGDARPTTMDGAPEPEGGYGPDRDKPRWSLDEDGRSRMEEVYAMSKFPPYAVRERLAREVGATMRQVQVWFQNRRQRDMNHRTVPLYDRVMLGYGAAPAGFYPAQQAPLFAPAHGAQGGPQPFMFMQPPLVPMPGALQNGFAPGPPPMPLPGAPGAVPMPMGPMPMPIPPGSAQHGQPPLPPHSRARLSIILPHKGARESAPLAIGPSPAHAHSICPMRTRSA